jgi:ribonuclease HI
MNKVCLETLISLNMPSEFKLETAQEAQEPRTFPRELIQPGLFAPWERPLEMLIPSAEAGESMHNAAFEEARNNPHHWCMYTDGSEIEEKVGAAAYSHRGGSHESRYLGTNRESNVYAAELVAMNLALQMLMKAKQSSTTKYHPRIGTIFSDSQAALKAIANPGNSSGQFLVYGVRARAYGAMRQGIQVRFQWIPSHIGIEGNEKADQLAKQATGWREQGRSRPPAPLWEHATRLLAAQNRTEKGKTKNKWAQLWRTSKTGQTLRTLTPTITKQTLEIYKGLPRAACSVLTQARTGKIAVKAYLHAINRAEDNKCACGQVQTVPHLLLVCPIFADLREQVWGLSPPACHKKLLNSRAKQTAKFLLNTGLLGQFTRATDHIKW